MGTLPHLTYIYIESINIAGKKFKLNFSKKFFSVDKTAHYSNASISGRASKKVDKDGFSFLTPSVPDIHAAEIALPNVYQ